jgi:NitT/TauT family transport system ATP-binding protein
VLSIDDIYKGFDGAAVLKGVSFAFPPGAVTLLSGPSGSGKTTLLNIIMHLVEPDAGTVSLAEGARLAAVFQEDRLIEHLSAGRNIRLTSPSDVSDAAIARALAALGLPPDDRRRVSKYSGGMRRRVAVARAALYRPDVLLLDEPFKGLDEGARRDAADFLKRSCPEATIVLVTHDREEAALMGAAAELRLQ